MTAGGPRPWWPLRRRAGRLDERMDDPHCDPVRLRRTYAQFASVNALVSDWATVFAREVRPHLPDEASLLDLGCGGGDLARRTVRLARHAGLAVHVTAVDPDPRAIAFAQEAGDPADGVSYRVADAGTLLREGARFDLVTSNHVLHHLEPEALSTFLRESSALARRRVVHADLRRRAWALLAFALVSWPYRGSYVRGDGFRSIRRAYVPAELRALVPAGWRVAPHGAFRQVVTWTAG